MKKVSIIDYGLSNIYNVVEAFKYIGAKINIITSPKDQIYDYLILPGVGSYEKGMYHINKMNLQETIINHVESNNPFLGICLGMQMMLNKSYEFGEHDGLGIISGEVIKIPFKNDNNSLHKIPHIGWNANFLNHSKLTKEIKDLTPMYFVHSYMASQVKEANIISTTNYNGIDIISIINYKNSFGCQFHPEKSGKKGLNLLENFISI